MIVYLCLNSDNELTAATLTTVKGLRNDEFELVVQSVNRKIAKQTICVNIITMSVQNV